MDDNVYVGRSATSVRPSTLARYEQELRLYIGPDLGPLRLGKIEPQHLSSFYRHHLEVLSPSTVRRMHALLRRALNVAVRWGLIAVNPAQLVDPPSVPHHEIEPLTQEEARRFLDASRATTMHARWALAVTLGLRQGEVLGLMWNDIDLDHAMLRVRRALQRQAGGKLVLVRPKTPRSRRTIRLPVSVVTALHGHHEQQQPAT